MARYILRNSLNPHKAVECAITFRQVTSKNQDGEPIWVLEVGTAEPHKDGGVIRPVFINLRSLDNLDEEIAKATGTIAAQVDWLPLDPDIRGPVAYYNYPEDGAQSVGLNATVEVVLKDILPSEGIDISSIEMTVNGFDVTNELSIDGNVFEYRIKWNPFLRVPDTY